MKTRQDVQNLLNKLPHTLQVTFALHCCNDIKHLITDPRSIEVLHLVEKWLHNPNSVTSRELYDAASYAANAASASYAANAAYAAYAANAAYAASAANAAANAAAYAAAYAAYAYAEDRNKYSKKYYDILIGMINDLTEIQKEFMS